MGRCWERRTDDEGDEMACERAGTTSILFLVYGVGKQVKALCQERGWLHIEEVMNRG